MTNDKKKKSLRYEFLNAHKKPVTRRDFLSLGLIQTAAFTMAPSLLTFFKSQMAKAQGQVTNDVPFLVIDLAGGAAMPGNFLVGRPGGSKDLLKDYSSLGWNPRETGALDETYAIPMSKKRSKMLEGINSMLSPEYRKNLTMGSILAFSRDDTSENVLSSITSISEIQNGGKLLKRGIGLNNTDSGGNSRSTTSLDGSKPFYLSNLNDFEGISNMGNLMKTNTGAKLKSMERADLEYAMRQKGNEELKNFLTSTYGQLNQLTDPRVFDPRANNDAKAIYGAANRGDIPDNLALQAAVTHNLLNNNVGASVISLGGFDYHDNSQTTGDNKDLEAGQAIGRAVQMAAKRNKPLFFQIITDGGVYAKESSNFERAWAGDSPVRSMTVIGFYNPQGNTEILSTQVGAYEDGGVVDQNTSVGNNLAMVQKAVMANYLNVTGRLGEFNAITKSNDLQGKNLEELLMIAKK